MGGDGMGGLALSIFGAMALIITIGFALFFLIAHFLGRLGGLSDGKRLIISLMAGFIGIGAAGIVISATFYEDTFSPPPELIVELPDNFAHGNIILLQDVQNGVPIKWSGTEGPFSGKKAEITVPRNGVLRVRSLEGISGRGDITVTFDDGSLYSGSSGQSAPVGLVADYVMAFDRQRNVTGAGEVQEELPYEMDELGAYIKGREQQTQ